MCNESKKRFTIWEVWMKLDHHVAVWWRHVPVLWGSFLQHQVVSTEGCRLLQTWYLGGNPLVCYVCVLRRVQNNTISDLIKEQRSFYSNFVAETLPWHNHIHNYLRVPAGRDWSTSLGWITQAHLCSRLGVHYHYRARDSLVTLSARRGRFEALFLTSFFRTNKGGLSISKKRKATF